MCNFHDPHTDTHAHRPAAFSEGPRPADSLISSSLQTEQKGMEIFHLLAETCCRATLIIFLLCLLATTVDLCNFFI